MTLVAVLLAFAAFDDITTDTDTNFTVEWSALVLCGVVLGMVSWRLLQNDHRWLGSVSMVALAASIGAGSAMSAGVGPLEIEYLTTIAALLWFLALAGILTGQAWRQAPRLTPN